ncbi:MAG TPA: MFS transporter [Candidatus Binataceae bacterium]|nr:MFS transporter [Candidatus Binataceae bacterium]
MSDPTAIDQPPPPPPRIGHPAFRALRHRNFRLYFGGQLTSLIGTWTQTAAQSWLVLKLTNSPLMLGTVSFANYLPILLFTLFAGVIIDRVDRRRLIIITQALMMMSAFTLAALTWTGVVRVEHVIAIAAFNGVVSSFDMPGRQAFVVKMVGVSDLSNAIAINSLMFNTARMVGPAVAGVLIAALGTAMCFFLNGVSFIAVIWSLYAMVLPASRQPPSTEPVLRHLREGFNYVRRHRPTRTLLLLSAVSNGLGSQYTVLVSLFARNLLHGGPSLYGFLLAAMGVGAAAGAVTLAAADSTRTMVRNLAIGLFVSSIAIVTFGLSPWIVLSVAAQVLTGYGFTSSRATTNTLLQLFVADELRGRVMSFYTLSALGMAPIGALEVGLVGEHLGPRFAVVICGAISLVCAIVLLTRASMISRPTSTSQSLTTP